MESHLQKLQKRFTKSVSAKAAPAKPPFEIIPGGRLKPLEALQVYRDGYTARLTQALGETFEGVWSVLGDELFFKYCRDFIYDYPSVSHNLSDYGERFPDYLREIPESKDFPFLDSLASFEWAFKELFHVAEHPHVQASDFNPERLGPRTKLIIGNAVVLSKYRHSVHAIWQSRRNSGSKRTIPDWNLPQYLLMHKKDGEIFIHPMSEPEWNLLSDIKNGQTLQDAVNVNAEKHKDLDVDRIAALFELVRESKIITAIQN